MRIEEKQPKRRCVARANAGSQRAIRLDAESDRYRIVTVVAVNPTWRDVWAILRGTYVPLVKRRETLTAVGYSRVLREVWTGGKARSALYGASPLLHNLATDKDVS